MIELFSNLFRSLSLGFRTFANIFSEHLILLILMLIYILYIIKVLIYNIILLMLISLMFQFHPIQQ